MKKSYIAFFVFLVYILYISWSKEGWKGISLLLLKGVVISVTTYIIVFIAVWLIRKMVSLFKRRF
ncbi:Predicted protein [Anoxybacillus flavithermus WK1]|uniref:Uncharacterized protein n=1 Tax=Anoxybacillus flavithermus (strain DSM 21510 / WK1) TaxID=491915 RepID=B7GFC4_ANOFW|nr:Predicted protein [Anoxybacillus flavithermus WK1]